MAKTTKRRKVWAVESLTGGLMLFASAGLAKKCAGGTKVAPLIELRRGDVVLSREDVRSIRTVLDLLYSGGKMVGPAVIELRALLRGGR